MVVPIITPQQVVIGTVGVDSLCLTQSSSKTTFYAHEVNFLQGVGLCLGEIHHWIYVSCRLLKVAHSALQWLHRRCPILTQGDVYLVQPTQQREEEDVGVAKEEGTASYNLCLMLSTSSSKPTMEGINKVIKPNENQFLDYLFECVGNSEPVSATIYGQHHLAYPIRDHTGCAVAVVDLCNAAEHCLGTQQLSEITKMLKLLTTAFYTLSFKHKKQGQGQGQEQERNVERGEEGEEEGEEEATRGITQQDEDKERTNPLGMSVPLQYILI